MTTAEAEAETTVVTAVETTAEAATATGYISINVLQIVTSVQQFNYKTGAQLDYIRKEKVTIYF